MAILPAIGRKRPGLRLLIGAMYVLLIAGAITMVYPFLMMLSGSVKANTDIDDLDAVPKILYSRQTQFARFQESRYGNLNYLSAAYGRELLKYEDAPLPRSDSRQLRGYPGFLKSKAAGFPSHFYVLQETASLGKLATPRIAREFRDAIKRDCVTIEEFNRRHNTVLGSWNEFQGAMDNPLVREFCYEPTPLVDRYLRFKEARPLEEKTILNLDGFYVLSQRSFAEVKSGILQPERTLAARCPSGPERVLWEEFVRHRLNCLFVRVDRQGLTLFRTYLRSKFPQGTAQMNRTNGTAYTSFEDTHATPSEFRNPALFALYTDFVANHCPAEHLLVDTPQTRYRNHVGSQSATTPVVAWDYAVFDKTARSYLWESVTRNYVYVIQYIAINGRAVLNTIVFIGLSILAALIVNPLAAYALSRFSLRSTYTVLMFFLATMAFPSAVTMIPNFLLLKHLHLLNTFWALILPGVANGYSIFILKGFFDSIPREVYESAMIDGASEWSMFWKFTMALSKPILALVTLGAFTSAYTAFMFALIICPDERMWTLMVWLYQMQQGAHQSVIYAALVIAAIPTLLVFVLAQNTILRGIVIPVEK